MNYKKQLFLLTALITFIFAGCSSPPPFTREQCGPYPENYAAMAREYATTTKILRVTKPGFVLNVEVTSATPEISNDRLHPGWLVRSQRKFVETAPEQRNEIQLPFSLIIYNGKIVWTSDKQYDVKLP